jgi:deoxyribodipyrimidine photolyase
MYLTTYRGFVPCRMSRDQRVNDNWALLYACEVAAKSGSPVAVAFNLVSSFSGKTSSTKRNIKIPV